MNERHSSMPVFCPVYKWMPERASFCNLTSAKHLQVYHILSSYAQCQHSIAIVRTRGSGLKPLRYAGIAMRGCSSSGAPHIYKTFMFAFLFSEANFTGVGVRIVN